MKTSLIRIKRTKRNSTSVIKNSQYEKSNFSVTSGPLKGAELLQQSPPV